MFMLLHTRPQNPRHFIALCFLRVKEDPSLRENNRLMKKVFEINNVAIFKCAYGYFLVSKSQTFSKDFYPEVKELKARLIKAG